MSRRDLREAANQLTAADRLVDQLGQREPAGYRFHPDLVETLIGLGDLSAAQAQADRLAQRTRALPPRCGMRSNTTRTWKCRSSAGGRRTLLAYGQILRRRNERRRARAMLTDAAAVFEDLGTPSWAEIARTELRRIPGRRKLADLTITEEQIA